MTNPEIAILKQQAQENTYAPHGNIADADCVIGFSFGYQEVGGRIVPGVTNEQLAEFISDRFPTTPLILQFEIADAIAGRDVALVIHESRTEGEYLNSKEIAEQAQIFMRTHGWETAALVTHPAMMARNDALCRKLGMATILPAGLEVIEYDQESVQPWTRDAASWWARERVVIDTCVENGWI